MTSTRALGYRHALQSSKRPKSNNKTLGGFCGHGMTLVPAQIDGRERRCHALDSYQVDYEALSAASPVTLVSTQNQVVPTALWREEETCVFALGRSMG